MCLDHEVLLYEDFETELDVSVWSIGELDATVGIDPEVSHWGDKSLRSTINAESGTASITHQFAQSLPSQVFVRWFVRLSAADPFRSLLELKRLDGTAHYSFFINSQIYLKAARDAESVDVEVDVRFLPTDAWSCVELAITDLPTSGDGDADVRVFIDDDEISALHLVAPSRSLEILQLGGYAETTSETRFDDMIVDTQRVGCTR